MIVSRLRLYKGRNNVLPERVIVYRDGVSEVSQIDAIALDIHVLRE